VGGAENAQTDDYPESEIDEEDWNDGDVLKRRQTKGRRSTLCPAAGQVQKAAEILCQMGLPRRSVLEPSRCRRLLKAAMLLWFSPLA
jgi:hypothetical protein